MIKCFCDRCGKEIIDNVNIVSEETDIVDCHDKVIMKFRSGISHICDECNYKEFTYGFKVGDEVITSNGRVGIIESICDCESCKKRGFYEPQAKEINGDGVIWITDTDKKNGFSSFYKIGDRIFGNIDEQDVLDDIKYNQNNIYDLQKKAIKLNSQLAVIKELKKNTRKSNVI